MSILFTTVLLIITLYLFRLRDVEISYQRSSTDLQKRLSASINWDANRDPSQKLSVDVQLDSKGRWHRAGHLALYYPGRVVNGEFEFLLKGELNRNNYILFWFKPIRGG